MGCSCTILLNSLRIRISHGAFLQQRYSLWSLPAFPFCSHKTANMGMNLNNQAHNFATKSCNNAVSLYLQRARLIDRIRIVIRSNSSDSLFPILNDPDLDSFVVANALKSAPSPDMALSLIETLKKIPHFTHNQNTLHALAKILAKSGQIGKLKALVNAINSGKFKNVDRVSFMDQMKLYAAAGDLDSVLCVWHEWKESRKRPNVESYNIIMELCVQTGKDYEAVKTFCRMIDEGLVPNSRTYTVIIEHLVKSGKLNQGFKLFNMLSSMHVKRTLRQYAILVDAFCGIDRFDVVKSLILEMKFDGILPGRRMLSSLQRMHDAGFVKETLDLIEEMSPDQRIENVRSFHDDDHNDDDDEDENEVKLRPWFNPALLASSLRYWRPEEVSTLEDANFVWTTRVALKMIRSFGSAESAWKFFRWVENQPGYRHNAHTVSRMITKLSYEGRADLVEELTSMIKADDINLSYRTIRVVIDNYGISRNGEAALKIFRNIKTLCGTLPKDHLLLLYSSLIKTLTNCKMDSTAMDTLDEMILSGILPKIQTFSRLMRHFALEKDIKTVQKIFGMVKQSGIKPDADTFRILIHTYCNSNRSSLAFRAFEDMKTFNLTLDVATKRLLTKSLWKEGKLREAAAVEETSAETNDVLVTPLRGNSFTMNDAYLQRVYSLYSRSFLSYNYEKDIGEQRWY